MYTINSAVDSVLDTLGMRNAVLLFCSGAVSFICWAVL